LHRLDTYPNKELIEAYRAVFSHKRADEVLYHMLYELGTFTDMPSMTAEDFALKNYGSRILNILGGGEIKQDTFKELIKRVLMQPLLKEEKEED